MLPLRLFRLFRHADMHAIFLPRDARHGNTRALAMSFFADTPPYAIMMPFFRLPPLLHFRAPLRHFFAFRLPLADYAAADAAELIYFRHY